MNQIKTLAALAVAAFALLSNLFALLGYTPPVALDHLLHLTPEQIASGAAVVLAFLAPLHSLAGDAVTMVREFLARGAVAEAENAKLRADLSDLAREFAKLKTAQAQQSAAPTPPAQAGRSLLSHLLIVLAVSLAGVGLLWLSACSTLTAPTTTAQTLAYTEAGVTAVRQTTLQMLDAGQISASRAADIESKADTAMLAIKSARAASATGDISTAQAQLAMASRILTALQAALPSPAAPAAAASK